MKSSLRALSRTLLALALCGTGASAHAQDPNPAAAPASAPTPAPAAPAPAPVPTPPVESFDDQARFLAGLPVSEGSPLAALQKDKDWPRYAAEMEEDWQRLKERRLDAMVEWEKSELRPRIDPTANLYYFFGGPDFIGVATLFPDAPVYILCGLEPIGEVPQLTALKDAALDRSIANLRRSLASTVRANFFKTKDMAADLNRTELRGVTPLLYLFTARAGARLLDSALIEIDAEGNEKLLPPGVKPGSGVPGVRIVLQRPGKNPQTLYYLRQNVENSALEKTPGFLAFYKKHGPANAFFKAASFILHNAKRFSKTRDFVLENSLSILQDDSGVPFSFVAKGRWTPVLYGRYLRPLPPFQNHLQNDLVEAFKDGPVLPLPFVTGYRHPGESNLVLASRKAEPAADVAATAAPPPPPPPVPEVQECVPGAPALEAGNIEQSSP